MVGCLDGDFVVGKGLGFNVGVLVGEFVVGGGGTGEVVGLKVISCKSHVPQVSAHPILIDTSPSTQ
jgi:hypothetical protein